METTNSPDLLVGTVGSRVSHQAFNDKPFDLSAALDDFDVDPREFAIIMDFAQLVYQHSLMEYIQYQADNERDPIQFPPANYRQRGDIFHPHNIAYRTLELLSQRR